METCHQVEENVALVLYQVNQSQYWMGCFTEEMN